MPAASDADRLIGLGTGVATFLVAWIYCIAQYGFLFGFGLGWLPSAILGFMLGIAATYLWKVVLALAAFLAVLLVVFARH